MTMTYAELSEEYRMSIRGDYHKVAPDLYAQMRQFRRDAEIAVDQAKDTVAKDMAREAQIKAQHLINLVLMARLHYIQKKTLDNVRDGELTAEETDLLTKIERVKVDFTANVLK